MYIFGYGSLLNSASRRLTGHTGDAIPALAHGLVRYWSLIDDSYTLSPLAVNLGEGQVNGVLLKVDEVALKEFDVREAGYHRIKLPSENIECFGQFNTRETIWVYITPHISAPTIESPIVQSYVDTVISGCLEVSENFAKHFIEHTVGWHHPMENDRNQPKYSRTVQINREHHAVIDSLLASSLA